MSRAEVGTSTPSEPVHPLAVFAQQFRADPYPLFNRIRAAGPLQPVGPSIWVAPRFTEVETVLQTPAWGHGYAEGINPFRPGLEPQQVPGSMLTRDPPEHTRLRGFVHGAFQARRVRALQDLAFEEARRLVARMSDRVDLMTELADPLPAFVLAAMMGLAPEEITALRGPMQVISRGEDPDRFLSAAEISARQDAEARLEGVFAEHIHRRRADPSDDLLGMLAAAAGPTGPLHREIPELAAALTVGAHGTVESMLGNGVLLLIRNPQQARRLRAEPERIPAAVEEMLRLEPPVQFTHRVALTDLPLAGQTLPRGSGVITMTAAANRDPRVYTDPDVFDIDRYAPAAPARRHLSFSLGVHFCLGALLGRMEVQAAITALLEATDDLALAGEPVFRPNIAIRSLDSLPVQITRKAAP